MAKGERKALVAGFLLKGVGRAVNLVFVLYRQKALELFESMKEAGVPVGFLDAYISSPPKALYE